KIQRLQQAALLAEGLFNGHGNDALLKLLEKQEPVAGEKSEIPVKKEKRQAGASQRLSFQLYQQGKSIAEIAAERNLAEGTVNSHLAEFIKTGELPVTALVAEEKINSAMKLLPQMENLNLTPLREKLGDHYSYSELRAVISH